MKDSPLEEFSLKQLPGFDIEKRWCTKKKLKYKKKIFSKKKWLEEKVFFRNKTFYSNLNLDLAIQPT